MIFIWAEISDKPTKFRKPEITAEIRSRTRLILFSKILVFSRKSAQVGHFHCLPFFWNIDLKTTKLPKIDVLEPFKGKKQHEGNSFPCFLFAARAVSPFPLENQKCCFPVSLFPDIRIIFFDLSDRRPSRGPNFLACPTESRALITHTNKHI